MTARPLVLQTEQLDEAAHAWLAERCEIIRCPSDDPAFASHLPRADALLIRTYTTVNESLLARPPRPKAVAPAAVGPHSCTPPACAARTITVVSTPGANPRAVVELVTAFMLDDLRPRPTVPRALNPSDWSTLRKNAIAPTQLCDLALGILGLGRVGSGLARVAAAMNMRTVYHDLLDIPESNRSGAAPLPFESVLREADILSIHVDGRASNKHLINAHALSLCKPTALIINTSRGFVLDPAALAAFLRASPSARAVLDVHDPEPFGPDYPLLNLPNCRLTPHIGAATATAHANMSWVVKDLWRVLSGEKPQHPATP